MSKFNEKKVDTRVDNYMGEKAFVYDDKMALVAKLLTSFAENSYYESADKYVNNLKETIGSIKDKQFAAKAAIFARNEFGMRSITHIVAAEIAKTVKGERWTKEFFNKVIHRPDDMTEILSLIRTDRNTPIPQAVKKGFKLAFDKFDNYQISKYKMENKKYSMIDLINLIHPIPSQKNAEALSALINGEKTSADTWETRLTEAGKSASTSQEKAALKQEAWADLVKSKKLGYFALLRNLRNILESAPDVLDLVIEQLVDPVRIRKSLILPFRFVSAYRAVEGMKGGLFESDKKLKEKLLAGIDKAVTSSVQNLPRIPGRTLILSDNSGSMSGDRGGTSFTSAMSNITTADIANLFATLYWMRADDTYVGLFGNTLKTPELDRTLNVMKNLKTISRTASTVGYGTEQGIYDMFDKLINEKIMVDTIVVFSDCQIGSKCDWYTTQSYKYGHKSGWKDFNKLYEGYRRINPNFKIYSVDLKGYGTTVFNDSVIKLAGWSDKIFDIMDIMSRDKKALIDKIESIQL